VHPQYYDGFVKCTEVLVVADILNIQKLLNYVTLHPSRQAHVAPRFKQMRLWQCFSFFEIVITEIQKLKNN
jgi:hypothetical protein